MRTDLFSLKWQGCGMHTENVKQYFRSKTRSDYRVFKKNKCCSVTWSVWRCGRVGFDRYSWEPRRCTHLLWIHCSNYSGCDTFCCCHAFCLFCLNQKMNLNLSTPTLTSPLTPHLSFECHLFSETNYKHLWTSLKCCMLTIHCLCWNYQMKTHSERGRKMAAVYDFLVTWTWPHSD